MDTLNHLLSAYPSIKTLTEVQLSVWPEHVSYLRKSFNSHAKEVLEVLEKVSSLIMKISTSEDHELKSMCHDYRYMCEELVLKEELYFRRHGSYRLSTFEDANREVYSHPELMKRYMNGLLLSGIFWTTHANTYTHYLHSFLPGNRDQYSHLEVGCGHGLLLYFASKDPRCQKVTGWDISTTSLASTKRCLDIMGVEREIHLKQQNLFDAAQSEEKFDSIVLSEVLEHLEDPEDGLKALYHALKPGGHLWINVPLNSPAPDHLYLLKEPSEVIDMVHNAGFKVIESRSFPLTGYTLEQAQKKKYTINCAVIATRD